MSDYPNGGYHLYLRAYPNAPPQVCEVHNGTVSLAGDERLFRLEKILSRGRLVRLVEVEQRPAGHEGQRGEREGSE